MSVSMGSSENDYHEQGTNDADEDSSDQMMMHPKNNSFSKKLRTSGNQDDGCSSTNGGGPPETEQGKFENDVENGIQPEALSSCVDSSAVPITSSIPETAMPVTKIEGSMAQVNYNLTQKRLQDLMNQFKGKPAPERFVSSSQLSKPQLRYNSDSSQTSHSTEKVFATFPNRQPITHSEPVEDATCSSPVSNGGNDSDGIVEDSNDEDFNIQVNSQDFHWDDGFDGAQEQEPAATPDANQKEGHQPSAIESQMRPRQKISDYFSKASKKDAAQTQDPSRPPVGIYDNLRQNVANWPKQETSPVKQLTETHMQELSNNEREITNDLGFGQGGSSQMSKPIHTEKPMNQGLKQGFPKQESRNAHHSTVNSEIERLNIMNIHYSSQMTRPANECEPPVSTDSVSYSSHAVQNLSLRSAASQIEPALGSMPRNSRNDPNHGAVEASFLTHPQMLKSVMEKNSRESAECGKDFTEEVANIASIGQDPSLYDHQSMTQSKTTASNRGSGSAYKHTKPEKQVDYEDSSPESPTFKRRCGDSYNHNTNNVTPHLDRSARKFEMSNSKQTKNPAEDQKQIADEETGLRRSTRPKTQPPKVGVNGTPTLSDSSGTEESECDSQLSDPDFSSPDVEENKRKQKIAEVNQPVPETPGHLPASLRNLSSIQIQQSKIGDSTVAKSMAPRKGKFGTQYEGGENHRERPLRNAAEAAVCHLPGISIQRSKTVDSVRDGQKSPASSIHSVPNESSLAVNGVPQTYHCATPSKLPSSQKAFAGRVSHPRVQIDPMEPKQMQNIVDREAPLMAPNQSKGNQKLTTENFDAPRQKKRKTVRVTEENHSALNTSTIERRAQKFNDSSKQSENRYEQNGGSSNTSLAQSHIASETSLPTPGLTSATKKGNDMISEHGSESSQTANTRKPMNENQNIEACHSSRDGANRGLVDDVRDGCDSRNSDGIPQNQCTSANLSMGENAVLSDSSSGILVSTNRKAPTKNRKKRSNKKGTVPEKDIPAPGAMLNCPESPSSPKKTAQKTPTENPQDKKNRGSGKTSSKNNQKKMYLLGEDADSCDSFTVMRRQNGSELNNVTSESEASVGEAYSTVYEALQPRPLTPIEIACADETATEQSYMIESEEKTYTNLDEPSNSGHSQTPKLTAPGPSKSFEQVDSSCGDAKEGQQKMIYCPLCPQSFSSVADLEMHAVAHGYASCAVGDTARGLRYDSSASYQPIPHQQSSQTAAAVQIPLQTEELPQPPAVYPSPPVTSTAPAVNAPKLGSQISLTTKSTAAPSLPNLPAGIQITKRPAPESDPTAPPLKFSRGSDGVPQVRLPGGITLLKAQPSAHQKNVVGERASNKRVSPGGSGVAPNKAISPAKPLPILPAGISISTTPRASSSNGKQDHQQFAVPLCPTRGRAGQNGPVSGGRSNGVGGRQPITSNVQRISCSVCDKVYPTQEALAVHMATHGNRGRFICEICREGFPNDAKLSRHKETVHTKPAPVQAIGPEFVIPICDISQMTVKQKLLQCGIRHFVQLSNLRDPNDSATFGIPIIPIDLARNEAFSRLDELGSSNFLGLGTLRSINQ